MCCQHRFTTLPCSVISWYYIIWEIPPLCSQSDWGSCCFHLKAEQKSLKKMYPIIFLFFMSFFFFLAFMVPWFPTPGLGQIWSQDDFISVTQKWEKSLPLSASKNPSDEPVWRRKISLWWNCSLVKTLLHFKGSHVKRFGNHYACSYSVHYLCKCTVCVCVEEDILYQPHQGKFTFFTWLLLLYTRVWNTHMQNQT